MSSKHAIRLPADVELTEWPESMESLLQAAMAMAPVNDELTFEGIRREVEAGQPDWTFIMLAVLPGLNGTRPSRQQVDEQLRNMARVIHIGSGLERYLFIDGRGDFVQLASEALSD